MPYNGSGTFSRLFNWVTDKANSVPVTASRTDAEDDGFATGLSTAICKDGQTVTTGRIPFVLGTSAMQGAVGGVSYGFTNDLDTGLYSPASGQWAMACDGTQVLSSQSGGLTVGVTLIANGAAAFAGAITVSATVSGAYFTGLGAMPVGCILDYAGSSAPSGWLLCFGQSLVRATYPALFTAIGTTYGAADGTHFTLPDCRGRLTAGKDDMGGSAASRITSAGSSIDGTALGAAGGAQTQTLSIAQMPAHDHGGATGTVTPTLGTFLANTAAWSAGGNQRIQVSNANGGDSTLNFSTVAGTLTGATGSIASQGGGGAHSNVQPTIIINKIIFAGV